MSIIGIIFFFGQWMRAPTLIDVSSVFLREEVFVFDNLIQKANETVLNYERCDDLTYNLDEFRNFAVDYAASKGMNLDFGSDISSCTDVPRTGSVAVHLILNSPNGRLERMLNLNW